MSISKEIILRHHSAGHVRLQIPQRLCSNEVAQFISEAIGKITGVYRVNVFKKQQKLAIRFVDEGLSFSELMQQLLDLLVESENKGLFIEKQVIVKAGLKSKLTDLTGISWVKKKYVAGKETVQAVGILAKLGFKKKPELFTHPEKTLTTFFNDILVLFLIKTHWKLITKKWLLAPLTYRYNWMAVFYLMYLFIRSKSKK